MLVKRTMAMRRLRRKGISKHQASDTKPPRRGRIVPPEPDDSNDSSAVSHGYIYEMRSAKISLMKIARENDRLWPAGYALETLQEFLRMNIKASVSSDAVAH